jgi:hypothetical protein
MVSAWIRAFHQRRIGQPPNKLTTHDSKKPPRRNLKASVRSRDTEEAEHLKRDLIEASSFRLIVNIQSSRS